MCVERLGRRSMRGAAGCGVKSDQVHVCETRHMHCLFSRLFAVACAKLETTLLGEKLDYIKLDGNGERFMPSVTNS